MTFSSSRACRGFCISCIGKEKRISLKNLSLTCHLLYERALLSHHIKTISTRCVRVKHQLILQNVPRPAPPPPPRPRPALLAASFASLLASFASLFPSLFSASIMAVPLSIPPQTRGGSCGGSSLRIRVIAAPSRFAFSLSACFRGSRDCL